MPFYIQPESIRSVYVEMLFCRDGPQTQSDDNCQRLAWGSAFLYRPDDTMFLVTARHNLTGLHWQTKESLGDYAVSPTHLRMAILAEPPAGGWPIAATGLGPRVGTIEIRGESFLLPLIGEDWRPIWLEHPQYRSRMDVAVLPVNLSDKGLLVSAWESPIGKTAGSQDVVWPTLAPGQDVFVLGYPDKLTTGPRLPLWVRGSIASEPYFGHDVGGEILPLMLVDARTRRGQSGSAVIRHRAEGVPVKSGAGVMGVTTGSHSEVVGVYSGRTSRESDLGYVWRIDEVEEICRNGIPPA